VLGSKVTMLVDGPRHRTSELGIIRQDRLPQEAARFRAVEWAVLTYFMTQSVAEKFRGGTVRRDKPAWRRR
jgi:hypothetical protein